MVRRENRRVASDDGLDRRVFFKFLVEKLPDFGSVPAFGVVEIRIELKIAAVKLPRWEQVFFCAGDGQVENGQVEEVNAVMMGRGKNLFKKVTAAEYSLI